MGLQKVEEWETAKVESWVMLVALGHSRGEGSTYRKPAFSFVINYSPHCHIDSNILGQSYLILLAEQAGVESLKILLCHPYLLLKWKKDLCSWNFSLHITLPDFNTFHRVLFCNKLSFQCQCVTNQLDTWLPKSSNACFLSLASQD